MADAEEPRTDSGRSSGDPIDVCPMTVLGRRVTLAADSAPRRTGEAREVDVEGLNSATLAEVKADPWDFVWARTNEARAWMLDAWFGLREPDEAANQWIRKAGAEHYGEHLTRLRDWVHELIDLRTRPKVDEWEG